jgi:hypothetical protein
MSTFFMMTFCHDKLAYSIYYIFIEGATFLGGKMDAQNFLVAVRQKLDVESRARAGLTELQGVLFDAVREKTPVWRGTLRDNWLKTQIKRETASRFSCRVQNDSAYAQPQNRGTKPGHRLGRAGIRNVQMWAQDKLGLDARRALGFAFAYRAKLKARGMLVRLGGNRGSRFTEEAVKQSRRDCFAALWRGFFSGM